MTDETKRVAREPTQEMYEAMSLDGASPFRMLWQLAVPLSKAGISTVAIFSAANVELRT